MNFVIAFTIDDKPRRTYIVKEKTYNVIMDVLNRITDKVEP